MEFQDMNIDKYLLFRSNKKLKVNIIIDFYFLRSVMDICLFIQYDSNACRIFRLRGSAKLLGDRFFEGRDKILLLDGAMKFGVILKKIALKFLKI